jgi:hypothetical protein
VKTLIDRDREENPELTSDVGDRDDLVEEHETHASTGGAAAAGAVTGGVIGLTGGPLGAAIGAVGGAIVGAAAERMMHGDDDRDLDATPVATSEADIPATDAGSTETTRTTPRADSRIDRDTDTDLRSSA